MDDAFDPMQTDLAPDPLDVEDDVTGWELDPIEHSPVVDEVFETFSEGQAVTLLDVDHSGRWDAVVLDVDNDGIPELLITADGDGYLVAVDTTGDGTFDHVERYSVEALASDAPEVLDYFQTAPIPVEFDTGVDDAITTTEFEASEYWFHQAADGLCVPASVAQIVSAYTGFPFDDESAFVALANELGLFSVGMDGIGGMTPVQALYLMEAAGVPASLVMSSSLDMLDSYLDQGHGVMLFVDSGQVWDGVPNGVLDHALVITEIDREQGLVVLADPGHPQGNGIVLPLDEFEQAWAAGDNQMIIGEQPAPEHGAPAGQPIATTGVPETVAGERAAPEGSTDGGDASSIDVQELIDRIRGDGGENDDEPLSAQEVFDRARGERPTIDLPGVVEDRLSAPETRLEDVTRFLVRRPWIMLPVAIAAARLAAR